MTVKAFTVVPTGSGVLRAVSERDVLDLFNARLAAISLSGFIFFGSSVKISDQVCSGALLSKCTVRLPSLRKESFHPAIFFSNVARRRRHVRMPQAGVIETCRLLAVPSPTLKADAQQCARACLSSMGVV